MAPAIFSAAHRYSPASFAVTPRILNTARSSTSVLPGLSLLPAFTHTTFGIGLMRYLIWVTVVRLGLTDKIADRNKVVGPPLDEELLQQHRKTSQLSRHPLRHSQGLLPSRVLLGGKQIRRQATRGMLYHRRRGEPRGCVGCPRCFLPRTGIALRRSALPSISQDRNL